FCFFFSSRRRHTRSKRDWSSDVCSSDLRENISQYTANPSCCPFIRIDSRWTVMTPRGGYEIMQIGIPEVMTLTGVGRNRLYAFEIGRASCREVVEVWVVVGELRNKRC